MPFSAGEFFNEEMLQLARHAAGLSQGELAEMVGVNQNTLSRWESGLRTPGDAEIQDLAAALDRPIGFFSRNLQPEEVGEAVFFHRKRAATRKATVRQVHARVTVAKSAIRRLLAQLEPMNLFLDPPSGGDPRSPEEVARSLRELWQVRPGPIRNLVGLLESAGCIIVPFDFGTFDIDAIGVWPNRCQPLIFASTSIPVDRLRFSLAHELGHLVLHTRISDSVEQEADRFAAELLLPAKSVKSELHDLNTAKVWQLKERWRVSGQCILARAHHCGMIDSGRYKSLMAYFSKKGWRRQEPGPLSPEAPTVMRQICDIFSNQLSYGNDELQTLTGCTLEELSEWLGIRRQLRVAGTMPRPKKPR